MMNIKTGFAESTHDYEYFKVCHIYMYINTYFLK